MRFGHKKSSQICAVPTVMRQHTSGIRVKTSALTCMLTTAHTYIRIHIIWHTKNNVWLGPNDYRVSKKYKCSTIMPFYPKYLQIFRIYWKNALHWHELLADTTMYDSSRNTILLVAKVMHKKHKVLAQIMRWIETWIEQINHIHQSFFNFCVIKELIKKCKPKFLLKFQ